MLEQIVEPGKNKEINNEGETLEHGNAHKETATTTIDAVPTKRIIEDKESKEERISLLTKFLQIHEHVHAYLFTKKDTHDEVSDNSQYFSDGEDKSLFYAIERGKEHAAKMQRRKSIVLDFIPVIGSAKMISEAIRGNQHMTGKKLDAQVRVIHGVSGAIFLTLDVTGIGVIVSELGKAILKMGEKLLLERVTEEVSMSVVKKESKKLIVRGKVRAKNTDSL